MAVNTLTAEFGNLRKEPRLRTVIDIMQSEIDSHRQAINELTAQVSALREELRTVTATTSSASK